MHYTYVYLSELVSEKKRDVTYESEQLILARKSLSL